MSIRYGLLAILELGNCYGYQLRQEFERRAGHAAPVNVGQVYTTLDRLERDELVRREGADDRGHVVYAITEAGRAAARQWFAEPLVRPASRDELAVRIALAATLPGVDVGSVVERQRRASALAVQWAERARDDAASDLPTAILLDAAVEAARADVRWLDLAAGRIAAAGDTALGLSEAVPKRGRPAKP